MKMAKRNILKNICEFMIDILKAIVYEFFLTTLAVIIILITYALALWLLTLV